MRALALSILLGLCAVSIACSPPVDALTPCHLDSDCGPEAICASDNTCYTPFGVDGGPREAGASDAGTRDAGNPVDAGAPDAGAPHDAGTVDAGPAMLRFDSLLVTPTNVHVEWSGEADEGTYLTTQDGTAPGQMLRTLVQGGTYDDPRPIAVSRTYSLSPVETPAVIWDSVEVTAPPGPASAVWLSSTSVKLTPPGGCGMTRWLRSVDQGPFAPITLVNCVDAAATSQHQLAYEWVSQQGFLLYYSQPATPPDETGPIIITQTAISDGQSGFSLSFTGASSEYEIWVGGLNAPTPVKQITVPGTSTSNLSVSCAFGDTCTVFVRGLYPDGVTAAQSASVLVQEPPAAPVVSSTPSPGGQSLLLSWPAQAGADSYIVVGQDGSGHLFTNLWLMGATSLTVYPPPFTAMTYTLISMRGNLHGDSTTISAQIDPPPALLDAPSSAGCSTFDGGNPAPLDQALVMPFGGTLTYVELQEPRMYTGNLPLGISVTPIGGSEAPLIWNGGLVAADSFLASHALAALQVSAGETVHVTLPAENLPFCLVNGAANPLGPLTLGGDPQPGLQLALAAWIDPSSDLPAPTLSALPETGAAYLSWTASPGASAYDLTRSADGGAAQAITSTSETWAIDITGAGDYAYQVTARDADGGTSPASNLAATHIDGSHLSVAQLAGYATVPFSANQSVGQSFTAVEPGTLASIEVPFALAWPGTVTLTLRGADGGVIASQSIPQSNNDYTVTPPIPSQWIAQSAAFSFADAGIQLSAGEQLQLTLTVASANYPNGSDYVRASSADVYDGGTLFYDGGAVAGQDLEFKVVLQ